MKLPAHYIQALIDGAAAAGYDHFYLGTTRDWVQILAVSGGRMVSSAITGDELALIRMDYEAVKESYRASLERMKLSPPPPGNEKV